MEESRTAGELLDAGELRAALDKLSETAESMPLGELARLTERAAALAEFDDLGEASAALAAAPNEPDLAQEFGFACVQRGVVFLAVPARRLVLRYATGTAEVRDAVSELVTLLEAEYRHEAAVTVLRDHRSWLVDWPHRYHLVFNQLMAGRITDAREQLTLLAPAGDEDEARALERVRGSVHRAELAWTVSAMDHQDLRGWHFATTGGVVTTLSPHGFHDGMHGRYALLQDQFGLCLYGLQRLDSVLRAVGCRPRAVVTLPDRSSRILATAAATLLGLPLYTWTRDRRDCLVVAYDLTEVDQDKSATLYERAPGEVLFEHATRWMAPPHWPADVSTLLGQFVIPPWGAGMRVTGDGAVEETEADRRPVGELVSEILHANVDVAAAPDETPPDDSEATLLRFVAAVVGGWRQGPREPSLSPGPVRSNTF